MLSKVDPKYKDIIYIALAILVIVILWKGASLFSKAASSIGDVFGAGGEAKKTADTVDALENLPPENNPWKPEYITSRMKDNPKKKYNFLTGKATTDFIKKLKDYFGFVYGIGNGEEFDIVSYFKGNIKHKTQLSHIANIFQQQEKKDFLEWFKNEMLNGMFQGTKHEHLNAIFSYINKLPE